MISHSIAKTILNMIALEQPQLGKTIQLLRQQKHLTQEELVERCNLNVRTLQRIEAGEVTPREFTIRAIMEALDEQVDEVADRIAKRAAIGRLHIAWIAGVVYFLSGFAEVGMDYWRFEYGQPAYFTVLYTAVKSIVLFTYAALMIGFIEIGRVEKDSLLKIGAYLMIGSMIIVELHDMVTVFMDTTWEEYYQTKGVQAVLFGGVNVLFGVALFRQNSLGGLGKIGGIFEIMAGLCFITFFLAFLGLFVLIPATLIEIVLIYRYLDELKK